MNEKRILQGTGVDFDQFTEELVDMGCYGLSQTWSNGSNGLNAVKSVFLMLTTY